MLRNHSKSERIDSEVAFEARPSAPTVLEENAGYIGRPNRAGLFYAACSRDFDPDPCGCPICRGEQHDGDA